GFAHQADAVDEPLVLAARRGEAVPELAQRDGEGGAEAGGLGRIPVEAGVRERGEVADAPFVRAEEGEPRRTLAAGGPLDDGHEAPFRAEIDEGERGVPVGELLPRHGGGEVEGAERGEREHARIEAGAGEDTQPLLEILEAGAAEQKLAGADTAIDDLV